jgi:hypothetical protein
MCFSLTSPLPASHDQPVIDYSEVQTVAQELNAQYWLLCYPNVVPPQSESRLWDPTRYWGPADALLDRE